MSQFIESICCIDGDLKLLELHQARVNRTFFTNYGLLAKPFKLAKNIKGIPQKGKYKCRFVYNNEHYAVSFEPYQEKIIQSLQIIRDQSIDYRFKYANRSELNELYKMRKDADDIMIIKNGVVTDSLYANLVFYDGEEWWTPQKPLLEGVKRQLLLDQRMIQTTNIGENNLVHFEKVSLINAMLDLGEVELPIEAIKH